MKIKAAVCYTKAAPLQVCEAELAEPGETEVLVKMAGCGICHADLAARDQLHHVPLPAVLGHEGSGVVERVGAHVKTIKPGDPVVLCSYSCGECESCISGHPSCCEKNHAVNFSGVYADGTKRLRDKNGVALSSFFSQSSFATYAVADERNTVKVDGAVELSLLGPLGCGLQTGAGAVINRLRPKPGDTLAVFGCGSVGLAAVMAAKLCGCSKIIGIDAVPSRLSMALELGATHVINAKKITKVAEEVKHIAPGGAEYSLDTTGVPALINESLYCLKRGGNAAIVSSTGDAVIGIQLQYALMGVCKSLTGVVQGDSIPKLFIPRLVEFYKEGRFPFDKLVRYYGLDEINRAFEDTHNGSTIKPVIRF